jgi:nitrogen regulatory protein PII-like uncharacterized protein
LLGGKKGGGLLGVLGAGARMYGAGLVGGDPSAFTEGTGFKKPIDLGESSKETNIVSETTDPENQTVNSEESEEVVTQSNDLEYDASGYPIEIDPAKQKEFQNTFAENRELKNRTFEWMASDGISREYTTQLEGEDSDEWASFLNSTTQDESASSQIDENAEEALVNEVTSNDSDPAFTPLPEPDSYYTPEEDPEQANPYAYGSAMWRYMQKQGYKQ